MVIAITLQGFNDLGFDPYFSFNGSFSLPVFCVFQKYEENLPNAPLNSIHLTSSFSCEAV